MNTMQAFLDGRESSAQRERERGAQKRSAETMELMGTTPEQRLLAFDQWVCRELAARLQWPDNAEKKAKLIGQCRAELEKLVLELWRRGWMLDGKRLADHITGVLSQIAERQRAGQVKDFYPFFRHVVSTYVGANAEEIQAEARRTPTVGSLLATMGVARKISTMGPSIPELVAQRREETLREKLTRARKSSTKEKDDQLSLL